MTSYQGEIWGSLPADYPTARAEATYRKLLDALGAESFARDLMSYAFKGVAYRYRAMAEYQVAFEASISDEGGAAPQADEEFDQERCLFGFFVSGLASLESLSFAVHAIGAHYAPGQFGTDESALRGVTPESVADALADKWSSAAISGALGGLIKDEAYRAWKAVRNVLSHRMVPPRLILISSHEPTRSLWHFTKAKLADVDEPLDAVTSRRREWMSEEVVHLWEAIEASLPMWSAL